MCQKRRVELDNKSDILAIGFCEICIFHSYSIKDVLKKTLYHLFIHTRRHTHTQTLSYAMAPKTTFKVLTLQPLDQ